MKIVRFILLLCSFFAYSQAHAQEEATTIYQGKRYIDINIRSQNKCNKRVAKQQDKLLHKLKKKESRYARKLRSKDSASYVKYQEQSLSYDSIGKLSKAQADNFKRKTSVKVDSLKKIQRFIQNKASLAGTNKGELSGYDSRLILLIKKLVTVVI
jgi:hypothetical protein